MTLIGPHKHFDLEVTCAGMSAATLAVELLLRATSISEVQVERSYDDSPEVRFIVVRFEGNGAYGAEFCLYAERLFVGFMTSPADWLSDRRARAFADAFEPLLSRVHSQCGARPLVLLANREE